MLVQQKLLQRISEASLPTALCCGWSSTTHHAWLNFKPRAPKCVTKRSSLCNCLVNTLRIVIRCSLAMNSEWPYLFRLHLWIIIYYNDYSRYVYWLSSLTTMCIDHGHFLTKLLGSLPQNDWWHIPCIAGPALGNQQSSRRIQTHQKGRPALKFNSWGTFFCSKYPEQKNNTKNTDIGLLQYFFKTKIIRHVMHVRHVSHSIVMVASKARLSNQNCLDLSSWQCQVCSCEDPPVLGTWSKQHQKNKCGTIVLHISQLSHRGSDGTDKGPLSFDCFGIIEMPKKDPLEKQNMSTCHVMKNQLWRVDLFLL